MDKALRALKEENVALVRVTQGKLDDCMKQRMEMANQLTDYENLRGRVTQYVPEFLKSYCKNDLHKDREVGGK